MRTRSGGAAVGQPGLILELDREVVLGVDWGREVHSPIKFNTFEVAGPRIMVHLTPGEDLGERHRQVWAVLDTLAERQFQAKLEGYCQRIRRAAEAVKGERGE